MNYQHLDGVYAAALTPLQPDFSPDLEALPPYLDFLARRGCHGVLLLGTTGEGPSFSPAERIAIFRAALEIRQTRPDFRLLAGTGTPSLEETVQLTKAAFDFGLDGAVVLPPYYYRKAPEDGLFAWFSQVLQQAVPAGGAFLGYHIPAVSGVGLSLNLLARLKDAFPSHFAGLKNSAEEPEHARQLGDRFGRDLLVLTGHDNLFSLSLEGGAGGCITASATLFSPLLRRVWEAHQQGQADEETQGRLTAIRFTMDRFPPAAALLKALLARYHDFPRWPVRPPLLPLSAEVEEQAAAEIKPVNGRG